MAFSWKCGGKAAAFAFNDDAVVVWTAAASPPLSYTPQQRCARRGHAAAFQSGSDAAAVQTLRVT
jgi:hypothetical protein